MGLCKPVKGSKTFIAGNIKNHIDQWKRLTSDRAILTAVCGAAFLKKGIIVKCCHEPDQFISTVFLREKKDGTFRMILNLKEFNKWVNYNHFKMESILTCTQLMKPHCYMGSIRFPSTETTRSI